MADTEGTQEQTPEVVEGTPEQPVAAEAPTEAAEPAGEPAAEEVITVEISVLPEGYHHVESFHPHETVSYMKEVVSDRFKIHPSNIKLTFQEEVMDDNQLVKSYRPANWEAGKLLPVTMTVQFAEEQPEKPTEEYKMPDVLEVNLGPVNGDPSNEDQMVLVKIVRENVNREKPFLGGYRHGLSKKVYHHASSQTVRKRRVKGVPKNHRETQTVSTIERSQQTCRESSTQMDRKDLYINHSSDKVIFARKYFTAAQLMELRDRQAREIQCFLRQCFAWRRVRRLREARYEEEFKTAQEKEQEDLRAQAEHKRQIDRRMHPRTKEDFDILHKELEAWRLHETQRIKNSGLPKEEVHLQLEELLGKQVKLLQTIDRLKITAAKENKKSQTKEMLEKMASPKEWATTDGDLIEVETPFTKRAKELVELYNGLCLTNLSKLQRVDVLLHVKYTVKEFDCDLTRNIVELIQREEDLIRRGRSDKSLEGLRKRLSNLFLQFIDVPEFNPEAANFQRVPYEPAK
jgi:hypothetical protein